MRVTGIFSGSCRRALRRAGGEHGKDRSQKQRAHGPADASAVYSQSLISNSGCSFRCRSLIFSSRYFAPTPFSKRIEAPRL